ncbi:DUF5684 domain-containing protein [Halanaerobium sp. Z-7514]|uniref:DUF5684 domain-containing protein n=1 Tax=Halanaerobium polyolivorans TaxID=2886943 RepID=A0AAW4X0G9_9FIRM|nr:DUF5684 domain-containing protein [Halanaerobium polyolivorans]MCC3145295.1 DUF5684 domain-containing protein [Halanaerobium polyolivorans]RQD70508.1 MAG: signal peptidase I [Halanaerobium sp. MSAO_Bac5]
MNEELIRLSYYLFGTICLWLLFIEAGEKGWKSLIPIYNIYIISKIADKPTWWLILLFIPIANVIIALILFVNFIKKFNQPAWHAILLLFIPHLYVFYIAFSDKIVYKN